MNYHSYFCKNQNLLHNGVLLNFVNNVGIQQSELLLLDTTN